jgi:DNA repair exonuclease SbcCD ATPase subunit
MEKKEFLETLLNQDRKESEALIESLNAISQKKQKLSEDLRQKSRDLLQELQLKKPTIEEKLSALKKQRQELRMSYDKTSKACQSDLQNYEETLTGKWHEELARQLKELRLAMEAEAETLPRELGKYWTVGDLLTITKMYTSTRNETDALITALRRGVTRIGLTTDEFLEWMDQNTQSNDQVAGQQ